MPDGLLYFSQSSHPLNTYNPTGFTKNFKKSPSICAAFDVGDAAFWGLALTSGTTASVIDGNPYNRNYHFAIGATTYWLNEDTFPGPYCIVRGQFKAVKTIDLWLKYNDLNVIRKLPGLSNYKDKIIISDKVDYDDLRFYCYFIGLASIYSE